MLLVLPEAKARIEDAKEQQCRHCQQALPSVAIEMGFCCHGCKIAYGIVHQLGLQEFYELFAKQANLLQPARSLAPDYSFLDAAIECNPLESGCSIRESTLNLTAGNIQCYACCWLIEHAIQRQYPNVSVRVNLSSKQISLRWSTTDIKASQLARFIHHLGYQVDVSTTADTSLRRAQILRLGVTWFCAANIMMLALADYLSPQLASDHLIKRTFFWLQAILGTVVIAYSATPFYRSALGFLRQRRVNIDQPIALAFLATYVFSMTNMVLAPGEIYFDSLAAIVALLITGRWLQDHLLRRSESLLAQSVRTAEGRVRVRRQPGVVWVAHRDVQKDDTLCLYPGEIVPVRAELLSEVAEINSAAISGEYASWAAYPGQVIAGGCMNGGIPVEVKALEDGHASFLATTQTLIAQMIRYKGRLGTFSDRLGAAFLVVVPLLALATAAYWWSGGATHAIANAMCVLLVACPCGFGLAAPLVFSRTTVLAYKNGFFYRSQRAIEAAAACRSVFIDKTGTLTVGDLVVLEGRFESAAAAGLNVSRQEALALLGKLSCHSSHQTALAICKWADAQLVEFGSTLRCVREVNRIREHFGRGLSGTTDQGAAIWLGADADQSGQTVFTINDRIVMRFQLDDRPLADAKHAIDQLRASGLAVSMLSGDQPERTAKVAKLLGIETAFGQQTPSNKALKLAAVADTSAMIGNGFNDLAAFAKASLSVAVRNAPFAVRQHADAYLFTDKVHSCASVFLLAKKSMLVLRTALVAAIGYNIIGLGLAISGQLTPVYAAFLMPISSATIIGIATLWSLSSRQERM